MRAAVDCREKDQGNGRKQIVAGNACGRKPGSGGSKVILLSCKEGRAITIASLPLTPALAAEQ